MNPGARGKGRETGARLGVGPVLGGGQKVEIRAVQPGRDVQRGTDPH